MLRMANRRQYADASGLSHASKPPSMDPPKARAQRGAQARGKAKELMRGEGERRKAGHLRMAVIHVPPLASNRIAVGRLARPG
jgi:hypothetical protein